MNTLKPCPFCGGTKICTEKSINLNYCDNCSAESNVEHWNTRPIENALLARAEKAEAMVERLMRMVEDRFVLVGNSLDGHLQDCNCAVFLSSRMERDAWSELCYEWHGIYSDWQSANGHQAGKVSENEGSEG